MTPHFTKKVNLNFEQAIEQVTLLLKEYGFGIITEIDVKETLKKKLDIDFRSYKILGACNPAFAHKALLVDDKVGIMMPCNVIVQEHLDGSVEITIINPEAITVNLKNEALDDFACEVTKSLRHVYRKL